jgi:predicted RNA-binding Zn ribbon-like protein
MPVSEALATPGELGAWLDERELLAPGARVTAVDLEHAHVVREALRTLLAAQNGVAGDTAAATAALDEAADRADLCIRFGTGEARCEPKASGVDGALGRILAEVSDGMADGSWSRLKACRAEDCLWAFVDTAKNQTRAWCSMKSCGNRAKVRTYRARHGIA